MAKPTEAMLQRRASLAEKKRLLSEKAQLKIDEIEKKRIAKATAAPKRKPNVIHFK